MISLYMTLFLILVLHCLVTVTLGQQQQQSSSVSSSSSSLTTTFTTTNNNKLNTTQQFVVANANNKNDTSAWNPNPKQPLPRTKNGNIKFDPNVTRGMGDEEQGVSSFTTKCYGKPDTWGRVSPSPTTTSSSSSMVHNNTSNSTTILSDDNSSISTTNDKNGNQQSKAAAGGYLQNARKWCAANNAGGGAAAGESWWSTTTTWTNTSTSTSTLSQSELDTLAQQYAPVLFFHPLEQFTMESVDAIFANPMAGNILYNDGVLLRDEIFDPTLNLTSLLSTTRQYDIGINSGYYDFQRQLDDSYMAGAGFDRHTGYSRAPIYYNVFQYDSNTIVFNYHLFFTFQGYAQLGVMTYVNGVLDYTQAVIPSIGYHESDWESIRVMVCNSPNATEPLAVSYQRGRTELVEITDCTLGECTLYQDTVHPVGFIALNSHTPYPRPTRNVLLSQIESDFIVELQGTLKVDRAIYLDNSSQYRMFMPNTTNVIRHKEVNEIIFDATNTQDYWQGFAGGWGRTNFTWVNKTLNQQQHNGSNGITCLDRNQTRYISCPTRTENAAFNYILEMAGLIPSTNIVTKTSKLLFDSLSSEYPDTGKSPRGPTTTRAFRHWNPISINTTAKSQALCSQYILIPILDVAKPIISIVPMEDTIAGIIIFCVVVMMINIIVITTMGCRRPRKPYMQFDECRRLSPPNWRYRLFVQRPTYHYTFFYIVTMIGMTMFFTGYKSLEVILSKYLNMQWDYVANIIRVMGALLIAIDTIFLFVLWIPTHDLWIRLLMVYNDMIGDDEQSQFYQRKLLWDTERAIYLFRAVYGFVFSSVVFSTLIVVFACFNIGIAYGFGEICASAAVGLHNSCLILNFLGLHSLECGTEFIDFCQGFARREIVVTVWGSFITAGGHYYLVSSAGAAFSQFQSILSTIYLLPNRDKYLADIVHLGEMIDREQLDRVIGAMEPTDQPPIEDEGKVLVNSDKGDDEHGNSMTHK